MHDIYVDTPDLQLCRHQAGLRVRQVDGRWVQTLKAGGSVSGGLHSRHEWEGEVPGPQPDLAALDAAIGRKQPIRALLRQDAIRDALQPVFTTRIERTVWQLRTPQGDQIECVLDQGVIESGGGADGAMRSVPVSEIELELKQGQAASLFDVALALLQDVPLQLGHMSKAERGYRLAAPQPLRAVKAQPLALDAAMSVEQAFLAIAGNCLEQVSGNQDGVAAGEDVESVHQMRVGLRRLRSALGMFKSLLALPDALKSELDWLGGALGEARDWDVLAGNTLAQLDGEAASGGGGAGSGGARAGAPQARASGPGRHLGALHGLHAGLAALAAGARLARQLFRAPGAAPGRARLPVCPRYPAQGSAPPDEARQATCCMPRRQQRHRVRIAAKKTRYATEFFASLFAARRPCNLCGALVGPAGRTGLAQRCARWRTGCCSNCPMFRLARLTSDSPPRTGCGCTRPSSAAIWRRARRRRARMAACTRPGDASRQPVCRPESAGASGRGLGLAARPG